MGLTTKSRSYGRKRYFRRRKPNVYNLSKRVSSLSKTMNRTRELKYIDSYTSATGISSTGSVTHLTPIGQTVDESGRIGESVYLKNIYAQLQVASGDTTNMVRVMLVLDRDSNGSVPALTTILDGNANASVPPMGGIELTNKLRFSVLYDKFFFVSTQGPAALGDKVFRKINKKCTFATTSTTPRSNSLYLVLQSDSSAVTHPTVAYSIRVRYTDS